MYLLSEQEKELKKHIKELIEEGKIDEAIFTIENSEDSVNRIVFLDMKRRIAKAKENRLEEKRLLDILLELDPDNTKFMSARIRIARAEGDKKTLKKWLDRQLQINPNNIIALRNRAIIAMQEGDLKTEKELVDREMELVPDDMILMITRLKLARKLKDRGTEKIILQKILELEPNNILTLIGLGKIAIEERDIKTHEEITRRILKLDPKNKKGKEWQKRLEESAVSESSYTEVERNLLSKGEEGRKLSTLEKIRNLIYKNDIKDSNLDKINELLKNVEETTREILLAELYFASNLPLRAEKSLKKYKKKLADDKQETREDIKIINYAIELVKGKKTKKYNWDNLWQKIEELEQGDER